MSKLLTVKQAAEILNVHPETLRRWDRQGRLKAVRIGTRKNIGDRKYRLEDIDRLSKQATLSSPLLGKEPTPDSLPDPVKLSERQRRIWDYLMDRNERAANAYVGALRVYDDPHNPDRVAQSAHSLRELDLLLVPKIERAAGRSEENGHIIRVKSFMKSEDILGGLPEEIATRVAKQWVDTYDWFTIVSHHGKVRDRKTFDYHLQILENIIESQVGPFYNSVEKLDRLMSKKQPSVEDAVALKALIKKKAHYEYFFKTLASPSWLPFLVKEGYFRKPPEPIKLEDGGIQYPAWVESEYLIRISNKKPAEVAHLILSCGKTDNPWVHCDFIDAALKMSSNHSVSILPKAKRGGWFDDLFMSRSAQKGGELMVKLVNDGIIDRALELAGLLLDVKKIEKKDTLSDDKNKKSYEAKSKIDDWQYEQLLKTKYPVLVKADPARSIILLRDLLVKAIRHVTGKPDYDDTFIIHYKRPSIRDDESNWAKEDVENQLITALRDSIISIGEKRESELKTAVASLSHSDGTYPIMLRLQMDAYRRKPGIFQKEIELVLSNRTYFFDERVSREYRLLLREHYPNLPDRIRSSILEWIENGPSGKYTKKQLEYWQTQKLEVVKDFLPILQQKKYSLLAKKYKPEPSVYGGMTKTWVGPTSPENEEKLSAMKPDDVIEYLIEWKPVKDFMVPSPDGLGQVFEGVVAKTPDAYAKKFRVMFSSKARPVYVYHLINGLQKAHKQGAYLWWDDILPTLEVITTTDNPYDYPHDEGFHDAGWRGVRKSICDLFEEALKKDKNVLPFQYRPQVWSILSKLVQDPEPNLEHEKKYGGKNMNPTMLSINTVRGDAFHALILYALWVSRNTYPDEKQTILPSEVKEVLEAHLDADVDPTETTRSIYGHYYPWLYHLDKEWASAHRESIFYPFGDRLPNAAWKAYLGYATYWTPVVNYLKPLYETAVEWLNPAAPREEIDNKLSEHIMISYWRGDLSLNDKIIQSFFDKAPEPMRAHAIWFLWKSLEEGKLQKTSSEWKRLRLLWHARVIGTAVGHTDEISRFADWLSSIPENVVEAYDLVRATIPHHTYGSDVGYLIGFLKTNISVNMEMVMELLYETVNENTEDVKYRVHDDEISYILTAAIQSSSEKSRDLAAKIINLFGERGNHNYKGILVKSQ